MGFANEIEGNFAGFDHTTPYWTEISCPYVFCFIVYVGYYEHDVESSGYEFSVIGQGAFLIRPVVTMSVDEI